MVKDFVIYRGFKELGTLFLVTPLELFNYNGSMVLKMITQRINLQHIFASPGANGIIIMDIFIVLDIKEERRVLQQKYLMNMYLQDGDQIF